MSLFRRRRRAEPEPERKKPPRAKHRALRVRILGPIVTVAALGVGYMLLDRVVPSVQTQAATLSPQAAYMQPEGNGPGVAYKRVSRGSLDRQGDWTDYIWSLSERVKQRPKEAMVLIGAAGVLALVLAAISRLTAYLLYFVGMLLLAADAVILVGAMLKMYDSAM